MKYWTLAFIIYITSFSLYACNKSDKLKTTQKQANEILEQLNRQQKEEIEKPRDYNLGKEKPYRWPIADEEFLDLQTISGAHNNCFSCNYQWNENTDPNLF
jgi:hypothetical protein